MGGETNGLDSENGDDDENESMDEANEEDYILSMSSNLEFLKAHSLFNKTAPLNFYPSMGGANPIAGNPLTPSKKDFSSRLDGMSNFTNFNQLLPTSPRAQQQQHHQAMSIYSDATNMKNLTTRLVTPNSVGGGSAGDSNSSSSSTVDFRFSTFLPPIYTKSSPEAL
jgi:hypothetical protein